MNKRPPLPLLAALLLSLPLLAADELINFSKLQQPSKPFKAARHDIFAGVTLNAAATATPQQQPATAIPSATAAEQPIDVNVAEEIFRSVKYVGYAGNVRRHIANLKISGEIHLATEGEVLLDKIMVKQITPTAVIIEYEGTPYEISLTEGDGNG